MAAPRIAIVGGGLAGLMAAIKVPKPASPWTCSRWCP